jgi:hypothetical protein
MGILPMSLTGVPPVSECSTGILPVSSLLLLSLLCKEKNRTCKDQGQDAHGTPAEAGHG